MKDAEGSDVELEEVDDMVARRNEGGELWMNYWYSESKVVDWHRDPSPYNRYIITTILVSELMLE